MKVVILYWSSAQNKPFDYSSKNYAELLALGGRQVVTLDLLNKRWVQELQDIRKNGVEFVITFQGLGTHHEIDGKNIWNLLKIPLVCLHGDHPSHWPDNHRLDSRYCLHLYANAEWVEYANRHFHSKFSASVGSRSLFPPEPIAQEPQGDFFVMAKNIRPPKEYEVHWQKDHSPPVAKAMRDVSSILREAVRSSQQYVRIHDLIDNFIEDEKLTFMKPENNLVFYHSVHSQLDIYMRNFKSVMALEALHDVPVKVYGKGWDVLEGSRSAMHSFYPGQTTDQSRELYNSRYGLIDISPAQGLHDRAKRALANKSAFTTNAQMDYNYEPQRYPTLFFNLTDGSLRATAQRIMDDPVAHQHACADFSSTYQLLHKPTDFLMRLEAFARNVAWDGAEIPGDTSSKS